MLDRQNESTREMGLADLFKLVSKVFRFLRNKWYWISLAAILGGSIGISYAILKKPTFQSNLTFALEEGGSSTNGALSLAAEFGFNIGGNGKNIFQGDNIIPILTSRRIVEEVLVSVDSTNDKPVTMADKLIAINRQGGAFTAKSRLDSISFPVGVPRRQFTYLQDSVLFNLYSQIVKSMLVAVRPDRKLNIYKVSFVSPNEEYTKIFTEKLVNSAIEYYTQLRQKRSKETVAVLESRVASMRGSARNAISGAAAIQDANVNPVFAAQQASIKVAQADATMYGTAYAELFKNLEMARYQMLLDAPLLQIIDRPEYPMKRIKPGRLKTGVLCAFVCAFVCVAFLLINRFITANLKK